MWCFGEKQTNPKKNPAIIELAWIRSKEKERKKKEKFCKDVILHAAPN